MSLTPTCVSIGRKSRSVDPNRKPGGSKPKIPGKPRRSNVTAALTKEEAAMVRQWAKDAGRSVSEEARWLILLGMGVLKLGSEVGADMDGSPESALASIKTRLKAAGKHGLTFGDPVVRPVEEYLDPEPDLDAASPRERREAGAVCT